MVPADVAAVGGAYVFMFLSNSMSQQRVLAAKDNQQISNEHPTYISPDGMTFAVWGVVYLFLLAITVAQFFPSERTDALLGQTCSLTGLNVRWRLALAFTLNGVWLPIFNNERFWEALVVMTGYLLVLLSIYSDLNAGVAEGTQEALIFTAGVAMNTSWILIAFMINAFFCASLVGWKDPHGVAGSVEAGMGAVLLVALLGIERAWRGGDLAWALVAAWGIRGIYRMQTVPDKARFPIPALNPDLAAVARMCSFLVGFIAFTRGMNDFFAK